MSTLGSVLIIVLHLLAHCWSAESKAVQKLVSTPTIRSTVGRLPALGWNSWNAYGCDIDESKILQAAEEMVSLGLKDAGYQYVNIDDCWSVKEERDSSGRIQPDTTKFPSGISGTASKVHDLGLLIGIYSDAGTATCAGYPGSLGNEKIDAETFASWNIDYLKYDNCNIPYTWWDLPFYFDWSKSNSAVRFKQMQDAIYAANATSTMQYSLCIWGTAHVWEWGAQVGQSWRMTGDIVPTWESITSIVNQNVQHLDAINFFAHNDMDMMEIGNGDLTIEEQRSHFALWAALKSPILLGTDLGKLSKNQIAIITNSELLAFSQDATIGTPAKPYGSPSTSPPEYYSGVSTKGTHVFILNTSESTSNKTIVFADVPGLGTGLFLIHDMWTGSDVGTFSEAWSVELSSHDTGAWLLTPV